MLPCLRSKASRDGMLQLRRRRTEECQCVDMKFADWRFALGVGSLVIRSEVASRRLCL